MNAQAAHCTLTHATLTQLQFLQVQKKEENLNREAEGGVEELQYLKHVVFAALHVCLCAIFLPAVYLVAWISRGRNEAAPGSWSCAAHGDVLLSTYCLLHLNLPHFSGYTLQGLLFLPFRVCVWLSRKHFNK